MNLFIVGNGFDIAHGLKTKYTDYQIWLSVNKNYSELYDFLSNLISINENGDWNNLENSLKYFEYADFFESACRSGFNDYSADDWSDADHHRHMQDVEFYDTFKKSFRQYLKEKVIDEIHNVDLLSSTKIFGDAINFNYTNTIKHYGINISNIYYIHGQYDSCDNDFILGHNGKEKYIEDYIELEYDIHEDGEIKVIGSCGDPREDELSTKFVSLYNELQKNYAKNIKKIENIDFTKYRKIYILGHSFGEVDLPYFEYIFKQTNSTDKIVISYYTEKDKTNAKNSYVYKKYLDKIDFKNLKDIMKWGG